MAVLHHPTQLFFCRWSYFGTALLNATGEEAFKGSLFQCMIAAALNMQTVVESHRGSNFYGTLEWQLNEM